MVSFVFAIVLDKLQGFFFLITFFYSQTTFLTSPKTKELYFFDSLTNSFFFEQSLTNSWIMLKVEIAKRNVKLKE